MKKALRFLAAVALLAAVPAARANPPVGTPPGRGYVWADFPGVGWGWVAPELAARAKAARPLPAVPPADPMPKSAPVGVRVVLLTAPDRCAPCKAFATVFDAWKAKHTRPGVEFVEVNVDRMPDAATRYGIEGIPAVVIESNGRVLARFRGAPAEADVTRYLPVMK